MKQTPIFQPYPSLLEAQPTGAAELAQADLIFVQDLGLVPKRIVAPSHPGTLPAAERKWLGSDFSHIIISQ